MRRLFGNSFVRNFTAGFALGAALLIGVQHHAWFDSGVPAAQAETVSTR